MSQHHQSHPTAQQIKDQFEQRSGFALEMRTLRALEAEGFDCVHGHMYVDPVTVRDRQFDLRAVAYRRRCCIRLAIECKAVSESCPMVFGRLPRTQEESQHQVLVSSKADLAPGDRFTSPAFEQHAASLTITGNQSVYLPGHPVGKTYLQYSPKNKKDADNIYDRWMQAVASSSDLVLSAHEEYLNAETSECVTFILPIAVVPDSSIWVLDYAPTGEPLGTPRQEECVEFAIMKSVSGAKLNGTDYLLSHLEFVTEQGLRSRIRFLLSNEGLLSVFPKKYLTQAAGA